MGHHLPNIAYAVPHRGVPVQYVLAGCICLPF